MITEHNLLNNYKLITLGPFLHWGWTIEAVYDLTLVDSATNQMCLHSWWLVLLLGQGVHLCPAQHIRAQMPHPAVMWQCLYQTSPTALRHWAEQLDVCLFTQSLLNMLSVHTTSRLTLHFLWPSAVHPPRVKSSQRPEAPPHCDVMVFVSNSPTALRHRADRLTVRLFNQFNIKRVICPNCTRTASVSTVNNLLSVW